MSSLHVVARVVVVVVVEAGAGVGAAAAAAAAVGAVAAAVVAVDLGQLSQAFVHVLSMLASLAWDRQ